MAHLPVPHWPYVFGPHCEEIDGGIPNVAGSPETGSAKTAADIEQDVTLSADQSKCVQELVLETVTDLVERDPSAVVLVFSDHGPEARLDWWRPNDAGMRERLANFVALYAPGHPGLLPDNVTLINVLPRLFNAYSGPNLVILDDRMYFGFDRVTRSVRRVESNPWTGCPFVSRRSLQSPAEARCATGPWDVVPPRASATPQRHDERERDRQLTEYVVEPIAVSGVEQRRRELEPQRKERDRDRDRYPKPPRSRSANANEREWGERRLEGNESHRPRPGEPGGDGRRTPRATGCHRRWQSTFAGRRGSTREGPTTTGRTNAPDCGGDDAEWDGPPENAGRTVNGTSRYSRTGGYIVGEVAAFTRYGPPTEAAGRSLRLQATPGLARRRGGSPSRA